MDRWKGRVALVTGASRGIGAGITKELVRHGMKVVACARNLQKLQELQNEVKNSGSAGEVFPVECDLRKEEDILKMFRFIKEELGGVDLCVNNAGIYKNSTLLEGKTEDWREMIEVNILALCICTRDAVQSMRDREIDDGQIIHISSMSGHRLTTKEENFYAATKQAVRVLTEGHRSELRQIKSHIRVACVSPAMVYTEMTAESANDGYRFLDVADVVDAVVYLVSAKPHAQVHDILIRAVEQVL